jgi:tRNA nucleotidyltransferase (CCA-adding enzyme)
MGLLAPLDAQGVAQIIKRLNLAPKTGEEILAARRQAQYIAHQAQRGKDFKPSEISALLKDLKLEGQLFIMAGSKQAAVKRAVSGYLTSWSRIRTAVSGKDLLALGFKPGPAMGAVKKLILDARLDGLVDNAEQELALAERELKNLSAGV